MRYSYTIISALWLMSTGICAAQSERTEIAHTEETSFVEGLEPIVDDSVAMEVVSIADSLDVDGTIADSVAVEREIVADSLDVEGTIADSVAVEREIVADSVAMEGTIADSLMMETVSDSLALAPVKTSFFKKIVNYFKDSNKDKTYDKKFDISIIGGPYYSTDMKFGIGLVAAGLYRTDRTDNVTQPSNISIFGNASTVGFWALGVSGTTLFNRGKHRLDFVTSFSYAPINFWGMGYDMGKEESNKSEFNRERANVEVDYMYLVASKLYLGVNASFGNTTGKKFSNIALLEGQKKSYTNTGVGAFLLYDSRDIYTAPSRGWLFRLHYTVFPVFLGNKPSFNRTEVTLNYYHKVWKDAILAYDLHGFYNSSQVPWSMLAQMGGSSRMRGYYQGRYQDKGLVEFQMELRQRVWRRIGVVGWVGVGNVFDNFKNFDSSHTLPTFGIGARWEFKKGVNVRLDYGIGRGESGFIFSINEAF